MTRGPTRLALALAVSLLAANSSKAQLGEEAPPLAPETPSAVQNQIGQDLPTDYYRWFNVSVGGAFIRGDKAQFQRRHQTPRGAFGGVDEFRMEQEVGEYGLLTVDGLAQFAHRHYSVRLELSEADKGYVRAGFRQFRTWYDGSGGFFRPDDLWISLYDEVQGLDRGELWFEAGLTVPDWPHIRFRYSHLYREGTKDSTIWGDAQTSEGLRGIAPSFRGIDETRNIFALDLTHTLAATDFGVGVRYELSDQRNTLNMRRRPGEAQDRHLTQTERVDTDLFSAHAFASTRFRDDLLFTSGYAFTTLDNDLSGSRIYGAGYEPIYDPTFARRQFRDTGFINLAGGSKMDQHVMNLNLMWTPWDDFSIVPSFRAERRDLDSSSRFLHTSVGAAPALAMIEQERAALSDRSLVDLSQRLEARYVGIPDWVFYGRGEWFQGKGGLREAELDAAGATTMLRDTDDDRFTQKYTLGVNWYPFPLLTMAGQYYHKRRSVDYDHLINPNPGGYSAFITDQNFVTDDINFRVTLRPIRTLTLVSRYDFQLTTIDTEKIGLASIQSGETTTHIFSQNATWSPVARLFLQGNINYVLDRTDTPLQDLDGPAFGLVQRAANDYWNTGLITGYLIDDKTDIQAQYYYYRADNYFDNSLFSLPLNSGAREHAVTVALNRRIRPNLHWNIRYGFMNNRDELHGGRNDYDAHLVYTGLRAWF